MAKSRVASLKPVTIPRLELTAALVSVRIGVILLKELEYEQITEVFWTYSKVVIGYISNDARRFHTFVANRVQQIRDPVKVRGNVIEPSRRRFPWSNRTEPRG